MVIRLSYIAYFIVIQMVAGKIVATTVSVTEEHKTEEIHDSPHVGGKPQLAAADDDTVAAAILPVVDQDQPPLNSPPATDNSEKTEPQTAVPDVEQSPAKNAVEKSPVSSSLPQDTTNKTPSRKEKSKSGKFSLFGKKKKKTPSESSSFEGQLELNESGQDDHGDGKRDKLQKRFSFGGKTGSKPNVQKSETGTDADAKEATKSGGFSFFSLKRNKPKECVKVSADLFTASDSPVKNENGGPVTQQEVFAVEGEGQIVVRTTETTDKSPKRNSPAEGVITDEVFNDYPVTSDGQHLVVVAIDFGTTFSGYAFSFVQDRDNSVDKENAANTWQGGSMPGPIHMMRRWEGGDPGVINQKSPTTLLLTPSGEFHSFGFTARNFYHDLDPIEAQRWLYFEKFKMTLHNNTVSTSLQLFICLILLWWHA